MTTSVTQLPVRERFVTRFDETARIDSQGNASWLIRTAYFGLLITKVERHATLTQRLNGESMVVSPECLKTNIRCADDRLSSHGDTLFIVPPGESTIEVTGDGYLARILGAEETAMLSDAMNASDYRCAPEELAPFLAWPAPRDGFRLRRYNLDEYANPSLPGRAFRCTNLMVNITDIYPGKRDSRKFKPHSHDDFEQITLTYAGRFAHHLRTPWGIDSTRWREDEHLEIDSPAAIALPAGLIHTSQALEAGCWLVDIFGPPRMDFARMEGFVRNANDYPLPV
ncbi:hypothetical protein BHUM_00250 [Candidatus Burkholderia humilis]|nr:hypothetical protein BHUM_00250 [Candidatus Burkholderia humilis]